MENISLSHCSQAIFEQCMCLMKERFFIKFFFVSPIFKMRVLLGGRENINFMHLRSGFDFSSSVKKKPCKCPCNIVSANSSALILKADVRLFFVNRTSA